MDNLSNESLKKFVEFSKKTKQTKINFLACMDASIVDLENSLKELLTIEQSYIFNEIMKYDIDLISVPKIGRLETILDFVDQEYLKKYYDSLMSKYTILEFLPVPERPESKDKKLIEEYNLKIKDWQKDNIKKKDWNTKFKTLTDYLFSIITIDLYGDLTIDITDKPYVYFKFLNTDIDEIEVFIQELKTCPAPPVKKITRVAIEDISGKLPSFLKSANEVKVFFDTHNEAEELHSSKDYVEGVYQKYLIKNDTMKADGGEWGIYDKRKDNLSSPVLGNFSINNIPTPVNLNSGDDEQEDELYHVDDYEVNLSDCVYAKTIVDDEIVYAIVPKEFWNNYKSVLINKNMFIVDISDNRKWRVSNMYFKYLGDVNESDKYLNDICDYSDELYEYINNEDNHNDGNFDGSVFSVDNNKATEKIKEYKSSYQVDITEGFEYEVFLNDCDDKTPILDNETDFNIRISPKYDSSFDQHIQNAMDIYMTQKDSDKLDEMCETMFEYDGTYGEFKIMIKKYHPFFESI